MSCLSIASLPAPALAGVVKERTVRAAIGAIKQCTVSGASMIDLHLPLLDTRDAESIGQITGSSRLPILALNYAVPSKDDDPERFEQERIESLLEAVRGGVAGVDLQGYSGHAASRLGFCGPDLLSFTRRGPAEVLTDSKAIDRQCALIDEVHSLGAEVLLSCHPRLVMSAEEVLELALHLEKRRPDVIKIVSVAKTEEDLIESIRAMTLLKKELRTPVTYHANGRAGILSRIINPLVGGHIAFCVERYGEGTDLEQIPLALAREVVDGIRKML